MTSQRANTPTAVVIGAGSGMGAAAAMRLRNDGYELILADLSVDRLETLSAQLGARAYAVDTTSDTALNQLASQCEGGVDALIVSAGLSASMASFERIVDVNLGGTARSLRHFLPKMRPNGAAICFASIAGHLSDTPDTKVQQVLADTDTPNLGERLMQALPPDMRVTGMAYALSKLGTLKLVQRVGSEWGKRGARICSISPGCIDTPMGRLERDANHETTTAAIAAAPIPRLGTPEEVADLVSFLCSPRASYITACDILIDGGWVGSILGSPQDSAIALALSSARDK